MTQYFGVAIAAEGVVEALFKTGDLAMVAHVGGPEEPVLAEYRDYRGDCIEDCDPECGQRWAFFGTDYELRPSLVTVVRRVKVVDA